VVQEYVDIQFGIPLPIPTVGEYLKRWRFTPQKPLRRAYEQSPAIANQGQLNFMVYNGGLNTDVLITFLKRLIKDTKRKVFLIVDILRRHYNPQSTAAR
jgi:hypothetical protein